VPAGGWCNKVCCFFSTVLHLNTPSATPIAPARQYQTVPMQARTH